MDLVEALRALQRDLEELGDLAAEHAFNRFIVQQAQINSGRICHVDRDTRFSLGAHDVFPS